MKIYDITLTVSPDIPVWPGDLKVRLGRVKKIEEGATDNLSQMELGVHTGTHMDAPYHFVQDGARIDELPLEQFVGKVQVLQVADDVAMITADVLAASDLDAGVNRILFKTRNSKLWSHAVHEFSRDFVAISEDAAIFLAQRKYIFVGIDYLSVGPFTNSKPTHDVLLRSGMALLEGADLSKVPPGTYMMYALPMKLGATEGAPARAILIEG